MAQFSPIEFCSRGDIDGHYVDDSGRITYVSGRQPCGIIPVLQGGIADRSLTLENLRRALMVVGALKSKEDILKLMKRYPTCFQALESGKKTRLYDFAPSSKAVHLPALELALAVSINPAVVEAWGATVHTLDSGHVVPPGTAYLLMRELQDIHMFSRSEPPGLLPWKTVGLPGYGWLRVYCPETAAESLAYLGRRLRSATLAFLEEDGRLRAS